jgi:hypothetical protein
LFGIVEGIHEARAQRFACGSFYLPREAAGGGPPAEERVVEGASQISRRWISVIDILSP